MAAEEQIISNNGAIMGALQLILAGGIGGAIVGGILSFIEKLFLDRKLAQQQAEHNKQLEGLKLQHEKKNTIHKLQFEMEFKLYNDFWKKLIAIKRTASITPMVDIIPAGKEPLDIYKERWMKAAEAFDKAIDFFDYNRPFYHNDVSAPAEKLLSQYKTHLIKLQIALKHGERKGVDIYEKDEELLKMINKVVVEIEVVIKARIGLLQEAKLIG